MPRRRRKSRPALRWTLVALGALALFAVGLWLGRGPGGAPRVERPRLPADEKAPRPERPRRQPVPTPTATPVPPAAEPSPAPPPGRVALIFDDLGRDVGQLDRLFELGVPLSFAVLPFEPWSAEVAQALTARGAEVLCHLPMEATGEEDPGPGALVEGMSGRRLAAAVERALERVPGAAGVNNHMGSRLTADERAMRTVLPLLGERGLFFLDSRTTPESVAYELALDLGVPAARRDVFLDAVDEPEAIRGEMARLLELARERGAAIAIAHPRRATLAVLAEEIPRALAEGFEFVPVSYLLERRETLPE